MRIFYSLGRLAYRYRWFVVLVWVALLVAGAFFAPNLSDRLRGGGFEGANSEAERVQEVMIEEFGVSPTALIVVFEGDGLEAGSPEFQEAQDRALDEVRELDEVENVIGYSETKDPRFISESGERSYALVNSEIPRHQAQGLADDVRERVRTDELETYVTGSPAVYLDLAEASNEDIRQAEKYAFPLALVILVLAFGSLVAAGIPILIGGAGVVVTLSALYFLAGVYEMSVFALTVSTMLGLGLGIDYALFAVSRFREELENGPVCEAVPRTVETAGRSIFFSGTAVLIGLTGLLFFPYMFMRSIGIAGALVVLFSVASALTLLPAVLAILGPKVNALSVRRGQRMSETMGAGFWTRSADLVMRHPVSVLFVVGVILLFLLSPVTHMKLGVPEASVLPKEYESRQGDDLLKEDFDYASLTPIDVVANLSEDPLSAEGLEEIRDLGERVEEAEGIDHVESIYTVGEEGAREYAQRLAQAREEAETGAAKRAEESVAEQPGGLRERYGSVPSGAEEQIRAEAEERAAEELNAQEVPELPEGISADGTVTPENVAVATLPDDPLSAEGLEEIQTLGERVEEAEGIDHVESIYTVGEEGAREYAEHLTEAREEAEAEAAKRAEESAAKQLGGLREQNRTVPLGAKESLPAEAERRATEELDNQLPELPEGISADSTVTPEDVANFLALPEVRESEEIRNALDVYTAGDKALLQAVPEDSPYTEEARDAVGEVRSVEPPAGTSFLVGGLSAGQKDFISNLYSNAPYAVAFVLGVTYLVLFLTFRSFFIPLKAVIVNILSLTASFGAMVFVFQDGNLSGLLGFTPLGFVDATLPILMFCTIFGISMDYEVFLLSRIRESYEYGESNSASVAKGLVSTAGIITSAAAIIVVVTGAFAFTGITTTKAIGLGLAVAVFVDATIIRILLVPATMRILGDWNWWPGGRKSVFRAK